MFVVIGVKTDVLGVPQFVAAPACAEHELDVMDGLDPGAEVTIIRLDAGESASEFIEDVRTDFRWLDLVDRAQQDESGPLGA